MNSFTITVNGIEYRVSAHHGLEGSFTIYIYNDNNTGVPGDTYGLVASAVVDSKWEEAHYDTPDGEFPLNYFHWHLQGTGGPHKLAEYVVGVIE